MTPLLAKAAFVALAVGWYVIRFPFARRAKRTPVARSALGTQERILLAVSFTGLGIIPFAYVLTGWPQAAERAFSPLLAGLGVAAAVGALLIFRLTHKALGRYWSVSVEIRENHRLVADGIYRRVRHPMYAGFLLWGLAQALLLPNWVAGLSGLLGFGTLYLFRVGEEERLMLAAFGDEYRAYAARTARLIPWLH